MCNLMLLYLLYYRSPESGRLVSSGYTFRNDALSIVLQQYCDVALASRGFDGKVKKFGKEQDI